MMRWEWRALLALVCGGFAGTVIGFWVYDGTGDQ